MKVTVKEWHAVALWQWNVAQDDVCGICRIAFDGTCADCKAPGDDCPLSMDSFFFDDHYLMESLGKVHACFPHALSVEMDQYRKFKGSMSYGQAPVCSRDEMSFDNSICVKQRHLPVSGEAFREEYVRCVRL